MTPSAPARPSAFLEEGRALVDVALEGALPPLGTPPATLHEAMRYTLLLPGKRLRGVVVLAACEMLRGAREDAVPLAVAVEMVHASSLILDDLPSMDNATLRRGKASLHRVYGEANAILAAIGLLNEAFAQIQSAAALKDRGKREASACLAAAIGSSGLIGGQFADLEATGRRLDLDALEYIHAHKTGALFIAAAELGAVAAQGRARDVEALRRYAKNLGLAFQITDDLLDYSGDPATTGKDAGLDRNRTTFANVAGIDGARRLTDELCQTAISALEPFGKRAAVLAGLADMVRDRDR
ncbi:MAG TPA: polyprenyl synthetase family protein [Candidatus Polarisedimenticolaceae bacterium]|nr:polyprenyl synthetase family protein [Candidatus Polarisedimenticolaceae bacterium]